MAAVNQDWHALQFVSEDLKRNREILMAGVKHNGLILRLLSNGIHGDKDIFLEAVREHGEAF